MSKTIVLDCALTLCEAAFFASREIDRLYLTEPLIGNYALVYALGLASSSYSIKESRPRYAEQLQPVIEKGIYVTPAHPIGRTRFRTERFNVQTESYWYKYESGAILFDPAEQLKTKPKPYANNRPQQGQLKLMTQGSKFRFFVFGLKREALPAYIRVGKFLSKARLEAEEVETELEPSNQYKLTGYYNPLDWPDSGKVDLCNVINIHPVPIMQAVTYRGSVYKLSNGAIVPAGLTFRFDSK